MISLEQLAVVAVSGAITENLLFSRALGVNKVVTRSKSYLSILMFGVLYLFSVMLSGLFAWEVRGWFENIFWWSGFKGMAVLLSISAAYFVILVIIGIEKVQNARSLLVAVAFNSASFGAVYFAISYQPLPEVLAYCAGCAVGVTVAMLLVHAGRERLEMCRVPRAFDGIPITLIYIGILGLAFYGLVGHRLPT